MVNTSAIIWEARYKVDIPASAITNTFILVYASITILFTILSNAFVVVAVNCHTPLKLPSNILLSSLACTDLLTATIIMPIACYYGYVGLWKFGLIGCKIWAFCAFSCCSSSILHLVAIAIDRYRAVSRPIEYSVNRTKKRAISEAAVVWIMAFIVASPPFITGFGAIWPEEFTPETPCTIAQGTFYAIYTSCLVYWFPGIFLVIIYSRIYKILRARLKIKIHKAQQSSSVRNVSSIEPPSEEPVRQNSKGKFLTRHLVIVNKQRTTVENINLE